MPLYIHHPDGHVEEITGPAEARLRSTMTRIPGLTPFSGLLVTEDPQPVAVETRKQTNTFTRKRITTRVVPEQKR